MPEMHKPIIVTFILYASLTAQAMGRHLERVPVSNLSLNTMELTRWCWHWQQVYGVDVTLCSEVRMSGTCKIFQTGALASLGCQDLSEDGLAGRVSSGTIVRPTVECLFFRCGSLY
jgi:hypothetical protein